MISFHPFNHSIFTKTICTNIISYKRKWLHLFLQYDKLYTHFIFIYYNLYYYLFYFYFNIFFILYLILLCCIIIEKVQNISNDYRFSLPYLYNVLVFCYSRIKKITMKDTTFEVRNCFLTSIIFYLIDRAYSIVTIRKTLFY